MGRGIKGIIVEIGGDTSALENSLKHVKSSTASLNKELRGINSLLKLDPKNTELLSQKQTVLAKNIKETETYLNNLKEAQERYIQSGGDLNNAEYRNLQREIINTENKLKNLQTENSKWTTAGRNIEEYGKKVSNLSNKINDVGTSLTTKLTLPIVGIATASVKAFNEVDEGADTVIKKTGAVGEKANELESIYKKVSTNVVGDFNDIGSAVGEINTRFGFTGDILEEASEKFLKFAKVNDTDVNTSIQKVSRYMGDAGIKASEYGTILDQLTSVAQASGISIDSLTEMLTKYGAPMRALGLETQECIAIFAGWEKAGVNTEIAFSGMKKAIGTWGKQGKDSTEEFKKTLEEIKRCPDIASATTKAIEVFGQKAGPDLADAIKGGRFEYSQFLDIVKGSEGTLENTYAGVVDEADEAQLAMKELKVQFSEVGEEALKTLVPAFKTLLKGAGDLISKYNNLSDSEKKQVNNMILFVASIGPAIKILGTLGKGISGTINIIGNLSQAIGVMKTGVASSSASVNNLAGILGGLTSPVGLATIGIAGLSAGVAYLALKETDAQKQAKEFAQEVYNTKQSFDEYNKSVDDTTLKNLSQIESASKLKDELSTLVDENGKVKEGYEGRVSFILNELNNALGTEYKLNGNVVQSYRDLQGEIDSTIEKKKAEIVLNGEAQKWNEAREKETELSNQQAEAQEKLNQKMQEYGMSFDDAGKKLEELRNKQKEQEKNGDYFGMLDTSKERKALEELINAHDNATQTLKENGEIKKQYETDYALFTEGKYNEIGQAIKGTTQDWTSSTLNDLTQNITAQKAELDKNKLQYEQFGNEVAQQRATQAEQNLAQLAQELTNRTTTIGTLGEEEKKAWTTLAEQSNENYKAQIDKMTPEMAQAIQDATGVVVRDTGLPSATDQKADEARAKFENRMQLEKEAMNKMRDTATALNKDTSVGEGAESLGKTVDTGFNGQLDGWTWAVDLAKIIHDGLTSKKAESWISSGASVLGGIIKSFIGFSLPDKGPLSDFDKSMPDMIDLMVSGINKNKSKLIKSMQSMSNDMNSTIQIPQIQDFGNLQGGIRSQIEDRTKTVFTTPQIVFNVQKMTDDELDRTFKYIDNKFGSKYS